MNSLLYRSLMVGWRNIPETLKGCPLFSIWNNTCYYVAMRTIVEITVRETNILWYIATHVMQVPKERQTNKHTYTYTHKHAHMHTHILSHTNIYTHPYTYNIHPHTHPHTYIITWNKSLVIREMYLNAANKQCTHQTIDYGHKLVSTFLWDSGP